MILNENMLQAIKTIRKMGGVKPMINYIHKKIDNKWNHTCSSCMELRTKRLTMQTQTVDTYKNTLN